MSELLFDFDNEVSQKTVKERPEARIAELSDLLRRYQDEYYVRHPGERTHRNGAPFKAENGWRARRRRRPQVGFYGKGNPQGNYQQPQR